ncbi:MAG: dTDP-4-dehydrorhamnose 3,5-epimerase [Dactylosporangium sp.]|nr:dTDP-4-dehydrorhamnose 3,5-epimerase [Dactylosporangium sp.]NNJ62850.1 dTDP-4-dehydrorhamnose 3,5-epimerase [Dactylosporangium sp.]
MKIRPLTIAGAFALTPRQHGDPRGLFLEWFRPDRLLAETGYRMSVAQANLSVSARGVVRGIHFAQLPPGQAKYVTCVRGAVLDVIVDIRPDSPTFGQWEGVRLDDTDRCAVYLAAGLGHGFCSLSDDTAVSYLCSETYHPEREHTIHPLDPDLAVAWPVAEPQLSARDAAAPSLAVVRERGLLPTLGGTPSDL